MTRFDHIDQALFELGKQTEPFSDSFVEELATRMKHESRRDRRWLHGWGLLFVVAVGMSVLGPTAYAIAYCFLWEVPELSIDKDGELAVRPVGVLDHYRDRQTGEYVTEMVSEDGSQMTLVSPVEFRAAGIIRANADPNSGTLKMQEGSFPNGTTLFLDPEKPIAGPLEVVTPNGESVILDSGKPVWLPSIDVTEQE